MRTTFRKQLGAAAGVALVSSAIALAPVFGQASGGSGGSGGASGGASGGSSGGASAGSGSGGSSARGSGGARGSAGASAGSSGRSTSASGRTGGGASAGARTGSGGAKASAGTSASGSTRATTPSAGAASSRPGSAGSSASKSGSTRLDTSTTDSTTGRSTSGSASTRAKAGTSGTGRATSGAARDLRDTTRDARETASDVRDDARDTVRDTRETTRDATRDAQDAISDADTRDARDTARETARDTRDTGRETVRDARETARETTRDARDDVRDTRDAAADDFRDAREEIRDTRETGDRFDEARSGDARSSSGFIDPNRDVSEVLRDGQRAREREFGEDPYEGRLGPAAGDPQFDPRPGDTDPETDADTTSRRSTERRTTAGDTTDGASDTSRTGRSSSGFVDPDRDISEVLRDGQRAREREFGEDPYEGRLGPAVGDPQFDPLPGDTDTDPSRAGTSRTRAGAAARARTDAEDPGDLEARTRADADLDARIDSRTGARVSARTDMRLNANRLGLSFDRSGDRLTIDNISARSPLADVGLLTGDQLLSINGTRVTTQQDLFRLLSDPAFAGQDLQLAVVRDGERELLTIEAEVLASLDAGVRTRGRTRLTADDIGLRFSTVSGRVVIDDLASTSIMSRFGFRAGDALLSINGVRVANDRQFLQFLTNPAFTRDDLQVTVWRDGQQELLTVDPQVLLSVVGDVDTDVELDVDAPAAFDVNTLRSPDIGLWLTTNRTGRGLIVADIADSGAIARFGFREGDQILSVNGFPVAGQRQFLEALFDPDFADRPVQIAVWRDGAQQTLSVDPATLIAEFNASVTAQVDPLENFGLVLDDRFDVPVIWRVSPRSAAFFAGLRPGDVIVSWNGTRITDPGQIADLAQQIPEGNIALEVSRNRQLRRVQIDASDIRTALRPSISGAGGVDVDLDVNRDRAFDPTGALPRPGVTPADRRFDPTGSLPSPGVEPGPDRSFDPSGSLPRIGTGVEADATIPAGPGVGVDGAAGVDADFNRSSSRPGVLPRIFGR